MVNMLSINRNNCLALLLLLLISHVAMTLHTTAHVPVDQTSCELCAGHGNPAHAIPPSTPDLLPPLAYETGPDYSAPVLRLAKLISYRQRAPPAHI
jgi:hypothetical protein